MIQKSTIVNRHTEWGTERLVQFVTDDKAVMKFVELIYTGKFKIPESGLWCSSLGEIHEFYQAEGYHAVGSIRLSAIDSQSFVVVFPDGRYFDVTIFYGGGFEIEEVERYEVTIVEERFRPISS